MVSVKSDTIAAIATPPGQGGIGIIRISGADSYAVGRRIFVRAGKGENAGKKFTENCHPKARHLYYGYIVDTEGRELDEVLISFMPAPYTYTCEDVVEINAHGGVVPLGNILKLITGMGVRLAEPGEFTKRAYLNGRIDLLQAESVMAVVNARSAGGLYYSIQGLKGFLSRELAQLGDALLGLLAEIAADADFPLDDLQPADYCRLREKVERLRERGALLRRRGVRGRILQEGLKTVIAGKPNVGKSSLYNLLLNEDRAIVTAVPGTTRDILTDFINIKGIPLRLMDTAGLRRNGDTVEQIGMEYSRRAIESGDLILFMVDLAAGIDREDIWIYENLPRGKGQALLVIGNKIDRPRLVTKDALVSFFPGDEVVEISAMTGEGMEDLEEAIVRQTFSGEAGGAEGALVLAARQAVLLDELVSCMDDAAAAMANDYPLDLAAIDLQQAYTKLQNLLGNELPGDLLDHIFRNFCIGK